MHELLTANATVIATINLLNLLAGPAVIWVAVRWMFRTIKRTSAVVSPRWQQAKTLFRLERSSAAKDPLSFMASIAIRFVFMGLSTGAILSTVAGPYANAPADQIPWSVVAGMTAMGAVLIASTASACRLAGFVLAERLVVTVKGLSEQERARILGGTGEDTRELRTEQNVVQIAANDPSD
jgi:hypothetical protein